MSHLHRPLIIIFYPFGGTAGNAISLRTAINSLQQQPQIQLLNPPTISPNVMTLPQLLSMLVIAKKHPINHPDACTATIGKWSVVSHGNYSACCRSCRSGGAASVTIPTMNDDKGAFTTIVTAVATAVHLHTRRHPKHRHHREINLVNRLQYTVTVADSTEMKAIGTAKRKHCNNSWAK